MALSNTATPKYYGQFRDAVIRGETPVNKEVEMEMNRIDCLIENPDYYYDDMAVEGWIEYCESELTLTDGSDLNLLDSFKLCDVQIRFSGSNTHGLRSRISSTVIGLM